MAQTHPTCFDCLHASVSDGHCGSLYEPPEEPWAECTIDDDVLVALQEEKGTDAAAHCTTFEPVLIATCAFCRAAINKPAWSWLHFVAGEWGPLYVCGPECADKLRQRHRELEQEDLRALEALQQFEQERRREIATNLSLPDSWV